MPLILEGILTTFDAAGRVNVAPMGPIVEPDMRSLLLRPFKTSKTYRNLLASGKGVFHVTDDVEMLAQAALGDISPPIELRDLPEGKLPILSGACRWYAIAVRDVDDSADRAEIRAEVGSKGVLREFFGFNRAKHAVLEGAILATRVSILPLDEILAEFARLAKMVEKTGGDSERRAFEFLTGYVTERAK